MGKLSDLRELEQMSSTSISLTTTIPSKKRLLKQEPFEIVLDDADKFDIDELDKPSFCEEVGPCTFCTADDYDQFDTRNACEETGRRSKFFCKYDLKESKEISDFVVYRSCKVTALEDINTMVTLQVVCLMIAIFSLISVQKQKQLNATLFDQRPSKRRQSSDVHIANAHADEERGINMSCTFINRNNDGATSKSECDLLITPN